MGRLSAMESELGCGADSLNAWARAQMVHAAPSCVVCVGLGSVVGCCSFEPVKSFLPQAVVPSLPPARFVPHQIEDPP